MESKKRYKITEIADRDSMVERFVMMLKGTSTFEDKIAPYFKPSAAAPKVFYFLLCPPFDSCITIREFSTLLIFESIGFYSPLSTKKFEVEGKNYQMK